MLKRTTVLIAGVLLLTLLPAGGRAGPAAPRPGAFGPQGGPLGQEDAALPVGLPRLGETALELIGRNDRGNRDVVFTGYLTFAAGAPDELLFTRTDRRTEETARFTFVAELDQLAASTLEAVRAETAAGTLTVFFNPDGGADFADAATFGAGTPVATYDLRTQDVLYDQSAASTLVLTSGELSQTAAESFEDEDTYRFGRVGAHLSLSLIGVNTRGPSGPNRTVYILAGRAELTGTAGPSGPVDAEAPEDGTPAPDEEEGTPESAEPTPPGPGGDDCAALVAWFETTSDQVADIAVLIEFLLGVEGVGDLNADELRAAAGALGTLAQQQRDLELPEEAAPVKEAVAAAMDALSEATAVAADAVNAGSDDDFATVQADLAMILDDLLGAVADAEALTAGC